MADKTDSENLINEITYSLKAALEEKQRRKSRKISNKNILIEKNCTKSIKTKAVAIFRKDNKVKDEDDNKTYATLKNIAKTKTNAIELTKIHIEKNLKNGLDYYINCVLENNESLDLNFIESLLDKGVDINFENENSDTILFQVAQYWNSDVVKFLVEKSAKIEHVNKHGYTILHMACISDNYEVIKYLMNFDKGIDLLNKKTKNNETPLHLAARYNAIQAINLLISTYEIDKEAKDYQGRTALYLAAEYARKSAVKTLIDLNCNIEVANNHGQTALFWIVTKIPEIANHALNMLHVSDNYSRKDCYYLTYLHPRSTGDQRLSEAKSVLESVAESKNLDIVIHPVILSLIRFKWNNLKYKFVGYIDFFFTIFNIITWSLLGVLVPYNQRYIYAFPADGWRIFLFIMGIIFTFLLLLREIIEVYSIHRFTQRTIKQRTFELDEEASRWSPKEDEKSSFLEQEKLFLKQKNAFIIYISDFWNIYDLISIALLLSVIFTHVADIVNHSELIARAHIRLMSVTIVFIALRLLKVGRVLNEKFGILVMTLQYVVYDVLVWLSVYILFLLPYTCSFWMIFGGIKFLDNVNEDLGCIDVNNSTVNCTTTQVEDMDTFNNVIFQLYRTTLGQDYDNTNMNLIDPIMYPILTGTYIGLTTLLLINIFIAMLSSTFQRLYDNSKANMLLQRAIEIVSIEQILSYSQRLKNYNQFLKKCNPYTSKTYNEEIKTLNKNENLNSHFDDRLIRIEDNLIEISQSVSNMANISFSKGEKLVTHEYFRKKMREFEVSNDEKLEILYKKMDMIENLMQKLISLNEKSPKTEPQIDILNLDKIIIPNLINVNERINN